MHACDPNHEKDRPRHATAQWRAAALIALLMPAVLPAAHAETPSADGLQSYRLSESASTPFVDTNNRLTAKELAETRGGFATADGFDFSFGLTNIRQINDEPLIRQRLVSANDVIDGLASGGASISPSQDLVSGNPVVLQLGANNHIAPEILAQGAGLPKTIIQNSLDNQHIRNTNIYDFTLDNVGALTRTVNRNVRRAALSQRLVDSIR